MKKPKWIAVIVVIILAGTAIWYWKFRTPEEVILLDTEKVVYGTVSNFVTATGTLQPVDTVAVGSQISGTIKSVYVDFNSPVKKGQLLAQKDKSLTLAQVEQYNGTNNLGYNCQFSILATTNQDENILGVKLTKATVIIKYDLEQIKHRRTVRSNYLSDILKKEDSAYLINEEPDFIHYIPNTAKEHVWLNEQTIEANRIQAYRDAAQIELANWIRFSSKDAAAHLDGLTFAGMEIEGITGWYLRNFYSKKDVIKKSFLEQSIGKVAKQVSQSAGWLLITSKDNSVATLLETGKRLQRLWLKIRDKNIAIHPMTQIIEEASTNQKLNQSIGINEPVQFILRTGYIKSYPQPVTLRRTVSSFLRSPSI